MQGVQSDARRRVGWFSEHLRLIEGAACSNRLSVHRLSVRWLCLRSRYMPAVASTASPCCCCCARAAPPLLVVRPMLTAVSIRARSSTTLTPTALSVQHAGRAFGVGSRIEHWPHDSAQKADVSVPRNEQYIGCSAAE
eukprot:15380-Heterococcus_DN1.PRE.2